MAKRKRQEKKPVKDVPDAASNASDHDEVPVAEEPTAKPEEDKSAPDAPESEHPSAIDAVDDEQEMSRKKRRKLKHAGQPHPQASVTAKPTNGTSRPSPAPPSDRAPPSKPTAPTTTTSAPAAPTSATSTKSHRYILFIGNLPFTTTSSSIQRHFSALSPGFTVRHSTDKATGKSRGFAFLEFENDSLMRRCITGYHHSIFYAGDPPPPEDQEGGMGFEDVGENSEGIHPARLQRMADERSGKKGGGRAREKKQTKKKEEGRRINVELTAGGGGGKSEARKEKLKTKNEKLTKERARVRDTQLKLAEKTARNIERRKRMQRDGGGTGANAGAVGGT